MWAFCPFSLSLLVLFPFSVAFQGPCLSILWWRHRTSFRRSDTGSHIGTSRTCCANSWESEGILWLFMLQYGSMDGRRIREERGKIMKPKMSHICRFLHSFPPLKYPPSLTRIATCDEKGAGKKPKTDVTQNSNRHSLPHSQSLSIFHERNTRVFT